MEAAGLTIEALRGVHFTSTTTGYVVGNGKTLIKFGEITSVEKEEELPTEFSLSQNYPNPFNPTTNIKYQIPESGFTSLKVYDALGNEVATLVNEELLAGKYEIEFDGNELTSGIYFYQLESLTYT
ncbi:MAG: T9SS type A sorting domain-containing protein, partial [Ignavibacteriaceae bacterium]|nr:T9SS type A sorting domain-containing protein [Ignavibacteria bacterium]NNJ53704.1 T9SS type A sorting domain-containing protein [Ignavibacteriaceae bacterium]